MKDIRALSSLIVKKGRELDSELRKKEK
jgi:hypothetical protein